MKTIALSILALLCIGGCTAQDNKPKEQLQETTTSQPVPKESWTVEKKVDEHGNVIRYDSTYTWSYSNIEGDSVSVNVDSVMRSFHQYFNQKFPSLWGHSFMDPMGTDSMLHRDFFMDDYFKNRWKKDFFDMDNMFHRMDSLRNRFFMEKYPGAIPAPGEK